MANDDYLQLAAKFGGVIETPGLPARQQTLSVLPPPAEERRSTPRHAPPPPDYLALAAKFGGTVDEERREDDILALARQFGGTVEPLDMPEPRMMASHAPTRPGPTAPGAATGGLPAARVAPSTFQPSSVPPAPQSTPPVAAPTMGDLLGKATGISRGDPERTPWRMLTEAPARVLRNIAQGFETQFEAGAWNAIAGVAENLGLDTVAQFYKSAADDAKGLGERVGPSPAGLGFGESAVYSGVQSIGGAAPSLAAGAVAGPAASLALMGATTGGNSYAEARKQGLSPERAALYGVVDGVIEAATERIPATKLLDDVLKGSGVMKTVLSQLKEEIPNEQFAELGQSLNAWLSLPENADKPFAAYVADRPSAAAQTFIATLTATVGQSGGAVALARLAQPKTSADVVREGVGGAAAEEIAREAVSNATRPPVAEPPLQEPRGAARPPGPSPAVGGSATGAPARGLSPEQHTTLTRLGYDPTTLTMVDAQEILRSGAAPVTTPMPNAVPEAPMSAEALARTKREVEANPALRARRDAMLAEADKAKGEKLARPRGGAPQALQGQDGKPITLYRGGKVGGEGHATYFTSDETAAKEYAEEFGGEVSAAQVSIQNPARDADVRRVAEAQGIDLIDDGHPVAYLNETPGLIEALAAEGFDGAIGADSRVEDRGPITAYVAFSPDQVLSPATTAPTDATPTPKRIDAMTEAEYVEATSGVTRLASTPDTPQPGVRYELPARSIVADPASLQYRRAVNAEGIEAERAITEPYDPQKGGVIVVWQRPTDGETVVVNGHHRLSVAKRDNADVAVVYVEAATAKQARTHGALLNLAEDHSSLTDAVQVLVDGNLTASDLQAAGVPKRSKVAKQAVAVASLTPKVRGQWRDGILPDDIAVAIGQQNLEPAAQEAVANFYAGQRAKGRELSPGAMAIAARRAAEAPTAESGVPDLFGNVTEDSLFAETVALEDYLMRTLAQDRSLFRNAVRNAGKLAAGGTLVDVEQATDIATQAAQTRAVLEKVVNFAGPVRDAIHRAAKAISEGQDATAVRAQLIRDAKAAARAELNAATGAADAAGESPRPPTQRGAPEGAVPPRRDTAPGVASADPVLAGITADITRRFDTTGTGRAQPAGTARPWERPRPFTAENIAEAFGITKEQGLAVFAIADAMGLQLDRIEVVQGGEAEGETLPQAGLRTDTPAFRRFFGVSKVTDEHGRPLVVYHGTRRLDRVGARFIKGRATSGPLPFFTDSQDLASKYAESKADTSLVAPEDYSGWFLMKLKGQRTPVDISRAWYFLSPEQRAEVATTLPHVSNLDAEGNEIDGYHVDPDDYGLAGKDHWDWTIREKRGNVLAAAVDVWLNSAGLFGNEQEFLDILALAGLKDVTFEHPHADRAGVLPVYLSIKNPLDTSAVPATVVSALERRAARQRAPRREDSSGDIWDKRNQMPREWVAQLKADLATGANSHVWTSIPDWVTDTLEALGYDGIRDRSGKSGTSEEHSVWIPFEPTQIKSAIGNRGTFDPDSSNILKQGLFDDDSEPVVDKTTAGDQPRLPGDVGQVREEERPTPKLSDIEDEFRLTPQFEKRKAKQTTLFQMAGADWWYDNVQEAMKTWQAKGTPEQVLAHLKKTKGALEEAKDTGLTDWLAGQRSVTRDAVLQYAREHAVALTEKTLGAPANAMDIQKLADELWEAEVERLVETRDITRAEAKAQLDRQDFYAQADEQLTGGGTAQYADYQLDGPKENYREILLSLPSKAQKFDKSKVAIKRNRRSTTQGSVQLSYDGKPLGQEYRDEVWAPTSAGWMQPDEYWIGVARSLYEKGETGPVKGLPPGSGDYMPPHFNTPNLLLHVRVNVRTLADGRRVLFAEEMQSDWHQEGRRKGYKTPVAAPTAEGLAKRKEVFDRYTERLAAVDSDILNGTNGARERRRRLETQRDREADAAYTLPADANTRKAASAVQKDGYWEVTDNFGNFLSNVYDSEVDPENGAESAVEMAQRRIRPGNEHRTASDTRVPDAPFKDAGWKKLALKRLLAMATDEGLDGIAWTTGAQQVDRYSEAMRQQVDRISWVEFEAGDQPLKHVRAVKNGRDVFNGVVKGGKFTDGPAAGKSVEDVLGKEVAAKIDDDVAGDLKGDGLTVGGEGMKGFYDRELVNLANDLAKRYGQRVEKGAAVTNDAQKLTPTQQSVSRGRWGIHDPITNDLWMDPRTTQEPTFDTREEAVAAISAMGQSGVGGQAPVHVLATPAEMREAIQKYRLPLYQGKRTRTLAAQNAKASVELTTSGKALIRALTDPDVSSPFHELAHVAHAWLLNRDIAPEARRGITDADIDTTEDWLGVERGAGWDAIPVKAKEKFARGFERYLRDGAAPTTPTKMHGVFGKMRAWLTDIYQTVTGSAIDIEITPAMRQVFDRLVTRKERLATEDSAKAKRSSGPPRSDENVLAPGDVPPKFKVEKPMKGPTGARIVGYEWRSRVEEGDNGRPRRVSDWSRSDTSEGTGRDIVHLFYVESADGKTVTVEGVGSAQKILGIAESRLKTIAKNEAAAQRYRTQTNRQEAARVEKAASDSIESAARSFRQRSPGVTDEDFKASLLYEKDGKFYRAAPFLRAGLEENGWKVIGHGVVIGEAADKAEAKPSGPPRRAKTVEPWQQTRAEFKHAEMVPYVEGIKAALAKGQSIANSTSLRVTPLRTPDQIRLTDAGSVQIPQGRSWVTLTDDQVFNLARQAGMTPPSVTERVYHGDLVRQAADAGKPIPAAVRAEYAKELADVAQTSYTPRQPKPGQTFNVFRVNAKGRTQYAGGVDFTGADWVDTKDKAALTPAQVYAILDLAANENDIRIVDSEDIFDSYEASDVRGYTGQDVNDDATWDASLAWNAPKVDKTAAGDQTRLPGDVGNVRDEERAQPTEDVPEQSLSLSSQQIEPEQAGLGLDPIAGIERAAKKRIKDRGQTDVLFQGEDQTNSPAFRRWFGDSVLVNADGSPMRLYHGTADDFDEFDSDHRGRHDAGWLGRGVYLTSDPELAGSYSTLKKPAGRARKEQILPLYARLERPYYATVAEKLELREIQAQQGLDAAEAASRAFTKRLRDAGHDGVILDWSKDARPGVMRSKALEIVVFDNTAVKSATGNTGAFDPKNPSILYQDGQRVLPAEDRDDLLVVAAAKVARGRDRATFDREMTREFGADLPLDDLFTEGTARAKTLADLDIDDYFNFKRIAVSDAEKAQLRGAITETVIRTGRVPKERESWQTIRQQAADLHPDAVKQLAPFQAMQAPFRAVRDAARRRINVLNLELIEARRAMEGVPQEDALAREAVIEAKERDLQGLLDTWMRMRSEDGRNLAMHRMTVDSLETWYDATFWMSKAKRELGLPSGTDLPIDVMRALQDILDRGRRAVETGIEPQPIQLELTRFMAGLRRSSLLETITALRKAGLLTGPKTHMRNVLGNAAFQVLEETTRIPAVLVDMALAVATGRRTVHGVSPRAIAAASMQAATKGVKQAGEVMRTGVTKDDAKRYDGRGELNSGIRWIDAYVNFVFRTMSASDRIFKSYAFRRSMEEQAALEAINRGVSPIELLAKPPAAMLARAIADAEFATFNNPNPVAQGLQRFKSALSPTGRFVVDMAVPFSNTPSNIVARMIEYTPVGLTGAVGRAAVARSVNGAMTAEQQRVFSMAIGRGLTGSALLYLGWTLAAAGLATGLGGDDEGDRNVRDAAGMLSGAIKIGNRWHQTATFSPAGNLVALGASMQRTATKPFRQETQRIGKMAAIGAGLVLEQPMLKGMADVLDALQRPESRGEALVGSVAGSFVPTFVNDIASAFDPYRRTARAEGWKDSLWTGAAARFPGLRNRLPARLTVFGEPQAQTTRAIWDPTIATVARDMSDQVLRELVKHDVGIGWPQKRSGESAEDFRARTIVTGQSIRERLTQVVESPNYRDMDAERQIGMLEDAIRAARDRVRKMPQESDERYRMRIDRMRPRFQMQ